jgi:hypothetical protein
MYLTDTEPAENSTFDFIFNDIKSFLLFSPKSYVTVINNTKLTQEQIDSIYKGAPFDANNHSTARVSFSVNDYQGNFFVYNYNLFYSWNGCSNQAISLNIDGVRNITNYIMCPVGVHEGDWERVSVLVCKSDWKVKRMAFSQHYWVEERDCTVEGQCLVDPETGHFMTFAGLDSHANYPEPSDLMVYDYVNGTISGTVELENLGGLFIGDRNNPDPYRKWVPRPELMLYIPPPSELEGILNNETLWALYAGNWGAPLRLPTVSLDCLNAEQTERFPCPKDNESTKLILRVLKLISGLPIGVNLGGTGDTYTGTASSNSSLLGYPGITGPLSRGYSASWIARPSPLIQRKNETTLICPQDTSGGTPLPNVDPSVFDVSVSTLTNYLIGVAIGDVAFSLLLVLVMALPTLLDKSIKVRRMVVNKAQLLAVEAAGIAKKATTAVENRFVPGTTTTTTSSSVEVKELQEKNLSEEDAALAAGGIDAVVIENKHAGNAGMGFGASTTKAPQATDAAIDSSFFTPSPTKSSEILEVQVERDDRHNTRTFVWFILGLCLFIAGIGMSIYGVVVTLNDSVLSAAISTLNVGSVGNTLRVLLITGLSLIGAFDIIVVR